MSRSLLDRESSKAARDHDKLEMLQNAFRRNRFIVAIALTTNKPCRVVLRRYADDEDTVKALLTSKNGQRLTRGKRRADPDQALVLRR